MFEEMDRRGFTFRLGSANAWVEGNAEDDTDDALAWLEHHGLIDRE